MMAETGPRRYKTNGRNTDVPLPPQVVRGFRLSLSFEGAAQPTLSNLPPRCGSVYMQIWQEIMHTNSNYEFLPTFLIWREKEAKEGLLFGLLQRWFIWRCPRRHLPFLHRHWDNAAHTISFQEKGKGENKMHIYNNDGNSRMSVEEDSMLQLNVPLLRLISQNGAVVLLRSGFLLGSGFPIAERSCPHDSD